MKIVRAFGQFWYDFIIGDDWKIAVAVLLALAATLALLLAGLDDHAVAVIGAIVVVACFAVSLAIDVRPTNHDRH